MRRLLISAAASTAMIGSAGALDLKDDSHLDQVAGLLATNEVCGLVFTDAQIGAILVLAAGQAGMSPDEIIPRVAARTIWMVSRLRVEMPTARERDQWCGDMYRIAQGF